MRTFKKDRYRSFYLEDSEESEENEGREENGQREEMYDSNNGVGIDDSSRAPSSIVAESSSSGENLDSERGTSEPGTNVGHALIRAAIRGTNMATSGSNATHRQTLSEEESNAPTPSNRVITFNGFARYLEPEEIVGHRTEGQSEMLFRVRWTHIPEAQLIESSLMCFYRPRMVMNYLMAVVLKNDSNHPNINSP